MTQVLVGVVIAAHFLAVVLAFAAWERGLNPLRWFLLGLVLQLGAVWLFVRALRVEEARQQAIAEGPKLRIVSGGRGPARVAGVEKPALRLVRGDL